MSITVLLSRGLHPVSGRPRPAPLDAAAIRLGLGLGPVCGLHAGPEDPALRDYLGHGLDLLRRLDLPAEADPLPALAAYLAAALAAGTGTRLILAGKRAEGGEDSGQLPYLLAARLGLPIIADAVALRVAGTGMVIEQALPRGARRRIALAGPAVVTVHPAAPPALPFAAGALRRGRVEVLAAGAAPAAPPLTEAPYRRRPRLMANATAAERQLLIQPGPEQAAAAILAHLTKLGLA